MSTLWEVRSDYKARPNFIGLDIIGERLPDIDTCLHKRVVFYAYYEAKLKKYIC